MLWVISTTLAPKKVLGCIIIIDQIRMMMRMLPSLPNFWQTLVYVGQYLREYAGVLWNPAEAASIQELEAVQNRAIRFVKSIQGDMASLRAGQLLLDYKG